MSSFKIIKINNSKEASIQSGKWKDPGARLYDAFMNACDFGDKTPESSEELEQTIKDGNYKQWQNYLTETYGIAPISKIKNSGPYGITPYSKSGCKYPHHVLKKTNSDEYEDGTEYELVVSIPGLKAAYSRAKQQNAFHGELKEHLVRHYKEMGIYEGSTMVIEERIRVNFDSIMSYITESSYSKKLQEAVELDRESEIKSIEIFNNVNNINAVYKESNTGLFDLEEIRLQDMMEQARNDLAWIERFVMEQGEDSDSRHKVYHGLITLDEGDYVQNLDKWISGDDKILFITGVGGSGKTYTSELLCKNNNAVAIHLDYWMRSNLINDDNLVPDLGIDIMKKYLDLNPYLKNDYVNTHLTGDGNKHIVYEKEIIKFIGWVTKKIHSDYNDKWFIIEGLSILYGYPVECLYSLPVIVKGTFRCYHKPHEKDYNRLIKFQNELKNGAISNGVSSGLITEASSDSKEDEFEKSEEGAKEKRKPKNGINRKRLYTSFIEWAKTYNPKNTFGITFDKDVFTVTYPFIPYEMRYFYRLANPILCVLHEELTFFAYAELKKLNSGNNDMGKLVIFAATPNDVRVFNTEDRKIYIATERNGRLVLGEELASSFDEYIQNMIDQGDILSSTEKPTEDEPEELDTEIVEEEVPEDTEDQEEPITEEPPPLEDVDNIMEENDEEELSEDPEEEPVS